MVSEKPKGLQQSDVEVRGLEHSIQPAGSASRTIEGLKRERYYLKLEMLYDPANEQMTDALQKLGQAVQQVLVIALGVPVPSSSTVCADASGEANDQVHSTAQQTLVQAAQNPNAEPDWGSARARP